MTQGFPHNYIPYEEDKSTKGCKIGVVSVRESLAPKGERHFVNGLLASLQLPLVVR